MELRQILKHTSFQKILPRVELRQILKHTSFQKILPRVLISTDISIYIYIYLLLMQPPEATVKAVACIGHYFLCR